MSLISANIFHAFFIPKSLINKKRVGKNNYDPNLLHPQSNSHMNEALTSLVCKPEKELEMNAL